MLYAILASVFIAFTPIFQIQTAEQPPTDGLGYHKDMIIKAKCELLRKFAKQDAATHVDSSDIKHKSFLKKYVSTYKKFFCTDNTLTYLFGLTSIVTTSVGIIALLTYGKVSRSMDTVINLSIAGWLTLLVCEKLNILPNALYWYCGKEQTTPNRSA